MLLNYFLWFTWIHGHRLDWCYGVWDLATTPWFILLLERFTGLKRPCVLFLKCFLFCKLKRRWHRLKSLLLSRYPLSQCFNERPRAIYLTGVPFFQNYSSRMAAIDYTVCLHSEVFVTTQGGNFPHFLIGHRRFLYGGHSKTIKPDKRKLAQLFANPNIGYVLVSLVKNYKLVCMWRSLF